MADDLIEGKYYWIRFLDEKAPVIGRYAEYDKRGGFDICGSDEGFDLGKVEVFLPCIEFKKD